MVVIIVIGCSTTGLFGMGNDDMDTRAPWFKYVSDSTNNARINKLNNLLVQENRAKKNCEEDIQEIEKNLKEKGTKTFLR